MKIISTICIAVFCITIALQATVIPLEEIISPGKETSLRDYLTHAKLPVLLKFYSPTCPPCKALAPIVEEFSNRHKDTVLCIEINVLSHPKEKQAFGIRRWPTLIFFLNGDAVQQSVGKLSLVELERLAQNSFKLSPQIN